MEFVYQSNDGRGAVGYAPPVLDMHGRPLVPARLVAPDAPEAEQSFKPGDPFHVDETAEPELLDFVRSHKSFRLVTRDWLRDNKPHGRY